MAYKINEYLRRTYFNFKWRSVLDTPPVVLHPDSNVAVLTQLQHKDLRMYLLAIKSFARAVRVGGVYILSDGTLTIKDVLLLKHHVPGLNILELSDARSEKCPTGGCWERILTVARLIERHYVVQLDADTLTLGALPEVVAACEQKVGFTIGTMDNQRFETMQERAQMMQARKFPDTAHVQQLSEANFDQLREFSSMKYVRGCAGFAGFPQGSFKRGFVEDISAQMFSILGRKWTEWGSEQVMSNIVVANLERSVVLPHPKYSDCTKMNPSATIFVHFIGVCRFTGDAYARMGRGVVRQLSLPS